MAAMEIQKQEYERNQSEIGPEAARSQSHPYGLFCYCALEATAGLWASSYMVLHKGIAPQTAAKWASFFYLGITLADWPAVLSRTAGDRNMVRCGQLTALPEL